MSAIHETDHRLLGDGSSAADARKCVIIDSNDEIDRMRYRCPAGHTRWSPTNNHVYCQSCADAAQHDDSITPEYWELHDAKTGETIPWSRIDFR
ncbi:hypothetical protein [Halomarina litorea]|uniref:hypothetical protein n=1 Tax=Halomarina litorea TaxID=2961595 RepID=UPI0020C4DFC1|nr:hypothetical protein [Halomarina sp. BCD28]